MSESPIGKRIRKSINRQKRGRMPVREYSREFARDKQGPRYQFNFDYIPPNLYETVRDKAKREGVSVRNLVLGFLNDWSDSK